MKSNILPQAKFLVCLVTLVSLIFGQTVQAITFQEIKDYQLGLSKPKNQGRVLGVETENAISSIVGPVTPLGTSPWPYYDIAAKGNADEIPQVALTYIPKLGEPLSGTFSLNTVLCNITLTGDGASAVSVGDVLIVAWQSIDGPGTGRMPFFVGSKNGNVLTANYACGQALIPSQSGLTVYKCGLQCQDAVMVGSYEAYNCTLWLVCNPNGGGWAQYDPPLALYRMYLRTGDTKYLNNFRQWTDLLWEWALDHGTKYSTTQLAPRSSALVSQFVRALDGHTERLPKLLELINSSNSPAYDGNDNREPGYMLIYIAVGARAETDTTRRAAYCEKLNTYVPGWIASQNAQGYWPEKNFQYPYQPVGVSPWRMFSAVQGLARSYEVFKDPALCNNSALAEQTLTALKKAGDFLYNYGYSPASRGVFYDVEHPADGLTGFDPNHPLAGTVTAALNSTTVSGSGTNFKTTFACNGTDFIGIYDQSHHETWTHKVLSCASDTSLTIEGQVGSQCINRSTGNICATSNLSNTSYYKSPAARTACGNSASYCVGTELSYETYVNGVLKADRNINRDLIWIFGWLYKTTAEAKWRTYGDEMFSASFGGPALGPGSTGPCGGPGCDGTETDYTLALHPCAVDPTLPCNLNSNYGSLVKNVAVAGPKRWAQASGIGGADNYLAWRGGAAVVLPITPPVVTPPVVSLPVVPAPVPTLSPAPAQIPAPSLAVTPSPAPIQTPIQVAVPVLAAVPVQSQKKPIVLPANLISGQIVKFLDNATIYLVKPEGLYPFDNYNSYLQYLRTSGQKLNILYKSADSFTIVNIPASQVLNQTSGTVTFSSNSFMPGSLVNDKGTIYLIAPNRVKIPFTSMDAFQGLGYNLSDVIKQDLSNYSIATSYKLSSPKQAHAWGSWLLYQKTIYYSTEQGMIPVPSWEVFLANGGQSKNILPMNSEDIKVLLSKPSLPVLQINRLK